MAGDGRVTVTGPVVPTLSFCAVCTSTIGPVPAAAGDARLSMIIGAVQAAAPATAATLQERGDDPSRRRRGRGTGREVPVQVRRGVTIRVRQSSWGSRMIPMIRTKAGEL